MTHALLLIDVQNNMLLPPEPIPAAATVRPAIDAVLEAARKGGSIVVYVRNTGGEGDPDLPGTDGWQLVHEVREGEHVVDKPLPDAFAQTNLGDLLPQGTPLAIVGMQSEYCIRETSLEALKRGYPVRLVTGAHGTYNGDESAAEVSASVEKEVAAAGGEIVAVTELDFA
jgi:nicotinamidase-related amidase